RNAERVIVILDRETRSECPGKLAGAIEAKVRSADRDVVVVIKNVMFENWLVADIHAVASITARFEVSKTAIKSVEPNRADHADAIGLLRKAAKKGKSYDKVADSKRILKVAHVSFMAANSRS